MIAVAPPALDLGDVQVDLATASDTIAIANDGPGDLVLADVRIVDSGTGASVDWTYVASGACASPIDAMAPCTLAEHQQLGLAITFAPSTIAARDATLVIDYHDTGDHSMSIRLDGRGLGATLARVGPMHVDLGRVPIGMTATATVSLANDGNVALDGIALAASSGLMVTPAMLDLPFGTPAAMTVGCMPVTTAAPTTGTIVATPPIASQVGPVMLEVSCTGTTEPLFASPSTIWLGEVRTGIPLEIPIELRATTGTVALTGADLATPSPALAVTLDHATTPATATLAIAATDDADLATSIAIHAMSDTLDIPISGSAVTATASAPAQLALGTFCVNQPTAPVLVALDSLGTATIALPGAPAFALATSPFAVRLVAPSAYPARLVPHGHAFVELSPAPATAPGIVTDELAWTTDLPGNPIVTTEVTAQFLADDGAISPPKIAFGQVAVSHLDRPDGHLVTIQNCGATALDIAGTVASPFEIDPPGLPASLAPGQIARVSVGFHPQQVHVYTGDLVVTSPQLAAPLDVALAGEGIANGSDGVLPPGAGGDDSSFYACSCSGGHAPPTGAIVIVLAVASGTLRRRRR